MARITRWHSMPNRQMAEQTDVELLALEEAVEKRVK